MPEMGWNRHFLGSWAERRGRLRLLGQQRGEKSILESGAAIALGTGDPPASLGTAAPGASPRRAAQAGTAGLLRAGSLPARHLLLCLDRQDPFLVTDA